MLLCHYVERKRIRDNQLAIFFFFLFVFSFYCLIVSTLFLTSRVYPWFIAVVGFALLVELVELGVYASVAVMVALKNVVLHKEIDKMYENRW